MKNLPDAITKLNAWSKPLNALSESEWLEIIKAAVKDYYKVKADSMGALFGNRFEIYSNQQCMEITCPAALRVEQRHLTNVLPHQKKVFSLYCGLRGQPVFEMQEEGLDCPLKLWTCPK